MCIFAQYKDILGVPREGIHSMRFFDFAVMDFIMTFIGSCIIAYFFKINVLFVFLYLSFDRILGVFLIQSYYNIIFIISIIFIIKLLI